MKHLYGLMKTSARRGVRELRHSLGVRGPVGEALLRDPHAADVLHAQYSPDQIQGIMAGRGVADVGRALGAGSEGVAYPALGRQGLGVLKVHDPTAPLYSPDFIEGKRNFINHGIPELARIDYELPVRQSPKGPIHSFMHEYVPGKDIPTTFIDQVLGRQSEEGKALTQRLHGSTATRGNYVPLDLGDHNLKITPTGPRAVDFIAAPRKELHPNYPNHGGLAGAYVQGMEAPGLRNRFEANTNGVTPYRAEPGNYPQRLLHEGFGGAKTTTHPAPTPRPAPPLRAATLTTPPRPTQYFPGLANPKHLWRWLGETARNTANRAQDAIAAGMRANPARYGLALK